MRNTRRAFRTRADFAATRWAHARRKFDEAPIALPPDKREGMAALAGLKYCNKLFAFWGAVQKPLPRRADKAASERGKTDFRRAFGMGRFCLRRAQVCVGQSLALPQGAMAARTFSLPTLRWAPRTVQ